MLSGKSSSSKLREGVKSLNYNKILYISLHDPGRDPGVENKIAGVCNVARRKGFEIERITQPCKTIGQRHAVMASALRSDAGIFIVRSFGTLGVTIMWQLMKARKEKRILICDQPSPLSMGLKEIWRSPRAIVKRIYAVSWGIISGPWALWPFHRIIEYAPESFYYSFGNENSILLMGNGIDINRMALRDFQKGVDQTIRLVGVANTSVHHGFDRMIRAISEFNGRHSAKATFRIIGGDVESAIIKSLKSLAKKLDIEDYVEFCGFQDKEFISRAYDSADIAVGSLGLFRIGLNTSSILKIREYALAGIPFITAGYDPDFQEDMPFRFLVPNDESISPIVDVLERFPSARKTFTDEDIRKYAIENLSLESKFDQMISGLL